MKGKRELAAKRAKLEPSGQPSVKASAHQSPVKADLSRVAGAQLPDNLLTPPRGRPVRIYMDGIWDLFHYGHARALEQAKKVFPSVHLLVGVCNDELTHAKKGKTVMNHRERADSLRHCKWVDEVVENAPWVIDQEFLNEHKIDYVAHDDIPYKTADSNDIYKFVKDAGRFIPTERTDGVSTSDLITRIVRDYDMFLRRNLERGATAEELNISIFKEQEIKTKKAVQDFRKAFIKRIQESEDSIKHNWSQTKDEMPDKLKELVQFWEITSQDFVRVFANLFTGASRLFRRKRRHSELIHDLDQSSTDSDTFSTGSSNS